MAFIACCTLAGCGASAPSARVSQSQPVASSQVTSVSESEPASSEDASKNEGGSGWQSSAGGQGASVPEIDINAFKGCTALEEVHIPASVERVSLSAFEDIPNPVKVYVEEGSYADRMFEFDMPEYFEKCYE